MAPDLVEAFITAFLDEINNQQREAAFGRTHLAGELQRLTAKLDGLYDAIAYGLRTDGLKQKLEDMERSKSELAQKIATAPEPAPYLHPNLAGLYRDRVSDLQTALSDPGTRSEAADILRGLIERIEIKVTENSPVAELIGDIVKLISLPEGTDVPASFQSSVKVVAGVGFEPTTFRL